MTWLVEILKVIAGGVVAAALTLIVNGWRQNRDMERAGRNLAIQLTDIFERIALACAEIPGKHSANQRDNPYDGSGIENLPIVPDLPDDDAGWRSLDATFAIDARTFATRRQQCRAMVMGIAEHGDAHDVETEVEDQALVLGDAAWDLAQRLRDRYMLGLSHIEWNLTEHFVDGMAKRDERIARHAREAAEWWDEAQRLDENNSPK
jgi:hypothetical protein